MNDRQECCNCQWWVSDGWPTPKATDTVKTGVCRRFPPMVTYSTEHDRTESAWPETMRYEWCGEFQEVEPDEDPA